MSGAMPLSLASSGSVLHVESVHGNEETRRYLAALGFVEGTEFEVVSSASGNVIVSIRGSRLGLNQQSARNVYCR